MVSESQGNVCSPRREGRAGERPSLGARLRVALLGISPEEASFERRRFHAANARARARLEEVGRAFLRGYAAALESADPSALDGALLTGSASDRGFEYEGASMALALRDALRPFSGAARWGEFVRGAGARQKYTVHVGAGWAAARIPWLRWRPDSLLHQCEPLLRSLVYDGYGFHAGYFDPEGAVRAGRVPRHITGYAARAFDQGLGRSLWFVEGGAPERIRATIEALDGARAGDLWSGVGLACTYAGGATEQTLRELHAAAAGQRPALCQGVAFAAEVRAHGANPAGHTELACQVLLQRSAGEAAHVARSARLALEGSGSSFTYEDWRERVQSSLRTVGDAS